MSPGNAARATTRVQPAAISTARSSRHQDAAGSIDIAEVDREMPFVDPPAAAKTSRFVSMQAPVAALTVLQLWLQTSS
jgi:hypothetical protein